MSHCLTLSDYFQALLDILLLYFNPLGSIGERVYQSSTSIVVQIKISFPTITYLPLYIENHHTPIAITPLDKVEKSICKQKIATISKIKSDIATKNQFSCTQTSLMGSSITLSKKATSTIAFQEEKKNQRLAL